MTEFKPSYDFDTLTKDIRDFMDRLGFVKESDRTGKTVWEDESKKDDYCDEERRMRYRHSSGLLVFCLTFDMPIAMWDVSMYDPSFSEEWPNCFHSDDFSKNFAGLPSATVELTECMERALEYMDDDNSHIKTRAKMAELCKLAREIMSKEDK